MRVPWTARRSNQSTLRELALNIHWNFGHLMRRTDSLEKTLMLEKMEENEMTEDEMVGWHH